MTVFLGLTISLSCIVSEITILVENRKIFLLHVYLAPQMGVTPQLELHVYHKELW